MMQQLPTKSEIKLLRSYKGPIYISIYAQYITSSQPGNTSRIQFKNLLKEARQLLSTDGLRNHEIDDVLQPATKLLDGEEFRLNYEHSLALFIGQDFFRYYRLPFDDIKPSVSIGKEFKIKPLLRLFKNNLPYYVLTLSYNGAQLLKGDNYNIKQSRKFPSMLKALNIDELPNERQLHMVASIKEGRRSEKYHGQYNENEVNKDMLLNYFRQIDHKINTVIKNKKIPLIIAGVDYLLPLYRQVNTYIHILDDEIIGSIEHISIDAIRQQICDMVANELIPIDFRK
jgi:hypothetical protein